MWPAQLDVDAAAREAKYAAKRERDSARRRQRRAEEAAARQNKEGEADAARGAPPPARMDFRVPLELVPDVLMLWDLCQARCCATTLWLL